MSKAGFQKPTGNRLPVSRGNLREDSTKAPGLCRAWLKIIAAHHGLKKGQGGNPHMCRSWELGKAQRKRCRDPRCSPRWNLACRGTFGGRRKAVRDRLALQGGRKLDSQPEEEGRQLPATTRRPIACCCIRSGVGSLQYCVSVSPAHLYVVPVNERGLELSPGLEAPESTIIWIPLPPLKHR